MITLLFGPMFSGKTTSLLGYERRFNIAKKRYITIKWSNDKRYISDKVVSHDGVTNVGQVVQVEKLADVDESIVASVDAVLIDEGQFFADLAEWCKRLTSTHHIVIAGLSGDFKQQPFQPISEVISIADNIVHLKSICSKCSHDAAFSARLCPDQSKTLIGSSDMYEPRCGSCFHSL